MGKYCLKTRINLVQCLISEIKIKLWYFNEESENLAYYKFQDPKKIRG